MNKNEFANIAAYLKAAYPMNNLLADKYALNAWYDALRDIDYETAKQAAKNLVCSGGFPSIAAIRKATVPPKKEWSEGWAKVRKAISRYGSWDEKAAMASFDNVTAEAVGCIGWLSICHSTNEEVTRGQFRQVFEQIANREHEKFLLPVGETKMLEEKV